MKILAQLKLPNMLPEIVSISQGFILDDHNQLYIAT